MKTSSNNQITPEVLDKAYDLLTQAELQAKNRKATKFHFPRTTLDKIDAITKMAEQIKKSRQ